jgi:hypothetical protein
MLGGFFIVLVLVTLVTPADAHVVASASGDLLIDSLEPEPNAHFLWFAERLRRELEAWWRTHRSKTRTSWKVELRDRKVGGNPEGMRIRLLRLDRVRRATMHETTYSRHALQMMACEIAGVIHEVTSEELEKMLTAKKALTTGPNFTEDGWCQWNLLPDFWAVPRP